MSKISKPTPLPPWGKPSAASISRTSATLSAGTWMAVPSPPSLYGIWAVLSFSTATAASAGVMPAKAVW